MNTANDETGTMAYGSLWLELSVDGQVRTYELNADEARAVAVGSLLRADFRIARPGVAPVQFYIEREGNDLWIVPAYGSTELRVDTARISGPRRIEGRAVIEFCGVRIQARVLDASLMNAREPSARLRHDDWTGHQFLARTRVFEQRELGSSKGALPTMATEKFVSPRAPMPEQATTRFAPMKNSVVIPVHRTVVIEPLRVIPLTSEPEPENVPPTLGTGEVLSIETTARIEPVNNLLAQDTIQMAPFWMTELGTECGAIANAPRGNHDARCASQRVAVSLSLGESPEIEGPRSSQPMLDTTITTCFEPLRISLTPFSTGFDVGTQGTTAFDVPSVRSEEPEPGGWLVRLGLLSKQQPLLAWLAGTTITFALSATIALFSQHHQRPPTSQLRHTSLTTSAAPSSASSQVAASPNARTRSGRAPELIIVIPAVASVATSSPKKGEPSNPELVAAVGHLMSGRYGDAQAAYSALAARSPDDPSLKVVSRLLAKKIDSKCSSFTLSANIGCPEVKP